MGPEAGSESSKAMASASSTSARNLFGDSRRRLCERAVASVHSLGSVGRQVVRGSRSHDILIGSAKQLGQTEPAMENSFNNLQRMQACSSSYNGIPTVEY